MTNLVDRYVIPIYNIENTENFELENSIKNITYKISLKSYSRHNFDYALINDEELKEVFKYGSLDSIQNFYKIMESDNHSLHGFTKTLLVIDFVRKDDSLSYHELFYSILDSFHFSISKGISYYKYFSFKSYASNGFILHRGTGTLNFGQTFLIHTLHSKPYIFSPMLREKHFLKKDDFIGINKLISNLYELYTMKENQYSKIVKLSIDYHKLSITFEKTEQAFLVLMISVEAMFKMNQTESSSKYITRITKVLSSDKNERGMMTKSFDRFSKLRNDIAHGDDFLEKEELKVKVFELHEYVRLSILKILEINSSKPLNNYYEDLFLEIEKRWNKILKE